MLSIFVLRMILTVDTHSCRKDAFYGDHQKNSNEDRPILSAAKM